MVDKSLSRGLADRVFEEMKSLGALYLEAYDREYDRGDFGVVRNAQSTIDEAVLEWKGKLNVLKERPKGDNYDLSGFREVVGVVCTPFAVYSDKSTTLEFATDGLRACASADELWTWVSGGKARSATRRTVDIPR